MGRLADAQVSFADVELAQQDVKLQPVLQRISNFLDEQGVLVQQVYEDLVRGLRRPKQGRRGMDAVQVLRSFVLQRIKDWDLRELRERIADGLSLRQFTAFRAKRVPSHQAFSSAFNRLRPETLKALNEAVIKAAVDLGLENGKKLRLDTTVVETDIHFPTDGSLLRDVVRVVTRDVKCLLEELPELGCSFPDRTRRARRRAQEIDRLTPTQRQRRQRRKYQDLMKVTQEVMDKALPIATLAKQVEGLDPIKAAVVEHLADQIEHYVGLGRRVGDQTYRRIVQGEQVPVQEKIFSIFEPHTDLIKRGKTRTPVEFGHKVLICESGAGLITDYAVLDGNPSDEDHISSALEYHKQLFDKSPDVLAGDRGFYSLENIAACHEAQVKIESIPQRGGKKSPERQAHEKTRAFKQAQRFRAGVEGRFSVLFRGRGMKRCRTHGPERFDIFVGAAILASNLLVLSELIRLSRSRKVRPLAA